MGQELLPHRFVAYQDRPNRLFFAIRATPDIATRVSDIGWRLRYINGLRGRPRPQACLHISLHSLGDYPDLPAPVVEAAKQAGRSVDLEAFEVGLNHAMSFAGDDLKPLVLRASDDSAGLITLHQLLGIEMKKAGLGRFVNPHFTPHMTLLYDKYVVDDRPIEAIRWTVQDFALVHSLLGDTAHNDLARWRLRG